MIESDIFFFELKVSRPSGPKYCKNFNGYPMFSVKNIVQYIKLI